MSAHCHLTRKRPLLYRDSLGHKQREIPGLVLEWFEQEQGVGPAGQRQFREILGLVCTDWAVTRTGIK